MKGEKRLVYWMLAYQVNYCICAFCKYGSYTGSPCSFGEYECDHPLDRIQDYESENAMEMGDCWGFRPSYSVEDAADIVGIILREGYTSTQWNRRNDGVIEVAGVSGGEY
ncbi:hypothetical protein LCGC14_1389780 [marine sediment metagenome]|uniref:Uncharacterized protein n=1 Tax=marine sediment metagenome TaxID=412755 RepID=A0A0F9K0B0_9ZZZZ